MSIESQTNASQMNSMHDPRGIDPELAALSWLREFDEQHMDNLVQMPGTDGSFTSWRLNDAVVDVQKDENGVEVSRTPVVELVDDSKDEKIVMPIADFLERQRQLGGNIANVREVDASTTRLVGTLAVSSVSELPVTPERASTRAEVVFAPIVKQDEKPKEFNFDHLFSDEDIYTSPEDAAVRPSLSIDRRKEVDDWTRKGAGTELRALVLHDKEVRKIITEFVPQAEEVFNNTKSVRVDDPKFEDAQEELAKIADQIRTNKDLRLQLGALFTNRVNELATQRRVGERIIRDAQKNAGYTGYDEIPQLHSREYVALLALSYIDGTFDNRREDEIVYDGKGGYKNGQHREAAREVLMYAR